MYDYVHVLDTEGSRGFASTALVVASIDGSAFDQLHCLTSFCEPFSLPWRRHTSLKNVERNHRMLWWNQGQRNPRRYSLSHHPDCQSPILSCKTGSPYNQMLQCWQNHSPPSCIRCPPKKKAPPPPPPPPVNAYYMALLDLTSPASTLS